MYYETCPHGRRIVCADDRVVFIDACAQCETFLVDLGFIWPSCEKEHVA